MRAVEPLYAPNKVLVGLSETSSPNNCPMSELDTVSDSFCLSKTDKLTVAHILDSSWPYAMIHFSQNHESSQFPCVQPCATPRIPSRRNCLKVCTIILIFMTPLRQEKVEGRLFTHLWVVIWNRSRHYLFSDVVKHFLFTLFPPLSFATKY